MATADPPTRVVIADDHDLMRWGLKLLLESMPEVELVGEARTGRGLVAVVSQTMPTLVVTDLAMPDLDGMAAIDLMRRAHPELRIIAMSSYDSADYIRRALRAGVNGYVLKGSPAEELQHAIRRVLEGDEYFAPQVVKRLSSAVEVRPEDVLTERQQEVLVRLVRGQSSKQIAYDLGLSSKTVDVHRAAVMSRLGLKDMASLTLYAVRNGLVDPNTGPPPDRHEGGDEQDVV